jgi:inner membrane protein
MAFRLWLTNILLANLGVWIMLLIKQGSYFSFHILFAFFIAILIIGISFPVFIIYLIVLPQIKKTNLSPRQKILSLVMLHIILAGGYAFIVQQLFGMLIYNIKSSNYLHAFVSMIVLCNLSLLIHLKHIRHHYFITHSNQSIMYTTNDNPTPPVTGNNKILYKAIVTGILIMVMLIPMIFVSNLVNERALRRAEVEKDVSSKWAAPQTVSGPYLYVPYKKQLTGSDGKPFASAGYFFILPEQLSITGNIDTEERRRSIYKVLLYKTQVSGTGFFQIQAPKNIAPDEIQWNEIKLCMGISDFKGIEQKIDVNFKKTQLSLLPGLPNSNIDSNGLSVNVPLTVTDMGTNIAFNTQIALRGSGQLHFMPLAGNSQFTLQSKWLSPSFDGNTIPSNRKINKDGFSANWSFNKANLPFITVLSDTKNINTSLAFGVSLLQPGDEYAQTDRCSKYAILLIGLSFALFFIMEIMQRKPVHPVQYVLVGFALIIFYTLLLSISEIVSFDLAYFVAASATILLITVYVHSHFQQAKTAAYFTLLLSLLYGFIFILLRLEDTALLVGSIGLFIILAIVMYASRRINWYQSASTTTAVME